MKNTQFLAENTKAAVTAVPKGVAATQLGIVLVDSKSKVQIFPCLLWKRSSLKKQLHNLGMLDRTGQIRFHAQVAYIIQEKLLKMFPRHFYATPQNDANGFIMLWNGCITMILSYV